MQIGFVLVSALICVTSLQRTKALQLTLAFLRLVRRPVRATQKANSAPRVVRRDAARGRRYPHSRLEQWKPRLSKATYFPRCVMPRSDVARTSAHIECGSRAICIVNSFAIGLTSVTTKLKSINLSPVTGCNCDVLIPTTKIRSRSFNLLRRTRTSDMSCHVSYVIYCDSDACFFVFNAVLFVMQLWRFGIV